MKPGDLAEITLGICAGSTETGGVGLDQDLDSMPMRMVHVGHMRVLMA